MTRKQLVQSIIFIVLFLYILMTVTYIIRTNGDVKDRFTGFYAEKLSELLMDLKRKYSYDELNAFLVLKDILAAVWKSRQGAGKTK